MFSGGCAQSAGPQVWFLSKVLGSFSQPFAFRSWNVYTWTIYSNTRHFHHSGNNCYKYIRGHLSGPICICAMQLLLGVTKTLLIYNYTVDKFLLHHIIYKQRVFISRANLWHHGSSGRSYFSSGSWGCSGLASLALGIHRPESTHLLRWYRASSSGSSPNTFCNIGMSFFSKHSCTA